MGVAEASQYIGGGLNEGSVFVGKFISGVTTWLTELSIFEIIIILLITGGVFAAIYIHRLSKKTVSKKITIRY